MRGDVPGAYEHPLGQVDRRDEARALISGAGADGSVTGSHRYADNGGYDVTLRVSDDDD